MVGRSPRWSPAIVVAGGGGGDGVRRRWREAVRPLVESPSEGLPVPGFFGLWQIQDKKYELDAILMLCAMRMDE
uniref:Uncharacterized protein n=1 Tax=Oryza sativa subsp. japonica TaxID=39947 RepID=Q6YXT8_ORYSJ|nr:hypothetical protein [Oryza sativa Japonica Group]